MDPSLTVRSSYLQHTHTHTHTRTDTHIHKHAHTNTHALPHTHIHTTIEINPEQATAGIVLQIAPNFTHQRSFKQVFA